MFFGGMYYKTQSFNAVGNRTCASLLFLAAIGIIMPTAAAVRACVCVCMRTYVCACARTHVYVCGGGY